MSSNAKFWKRYLSPSFVVGKVREKGFIYCACWLLNLIWQSA